jgi:hypothetical protein
MAETAIVWDVVMVTQLSDLGKFSLCRSVRRSENRAWCLDSIRQGVKLVVSLVTRRTAEVGFVSVITVVAQVFEAVKISLRGSKC